jgi:PAS domain S-box-containing protein
MSNSNPLLWPRPSVMVSYGIAVLSVAAAVIIGQVPALHLQAAPVSLFLCAVMFSAWFGGVGPGLLAISLSVLAFDYYVLPPIYSLALKPEEIPRLVIFTLSALFVGSLSAAQRSAAESLRRGRDDLEVTGQELKRINEALRLENAGRKRIEAALQQSEAYLAEAQRLSLTGSFGWKHSSGELFWSEECFRIFEYDQTIKPTRKLVLQRVHPEDAALVKQTIERALQDGKDSDLVHRLLMPDGSVKYVHVVAHASHDESGSLEFVGAVMDVTEQQQARAALEKAFDEIKKSQDQLQLVIDTIPSMVWSALPSGSIDFFSQRWTDYHGHSLEDLKRQGVEAVIHHDDVARVRETVVAAMAAGKPFEFEFRSRRADGQYRWFLSRAVPLRDEMGIIVKWYGTITDIEDRKRAEMLLGGEKRLLEMIARGDSRALILDALCRLVEELTSGALSSILLLDANANRLRHGAAPSLPINYTEAIDGLVIGPSVGSCGTAAYRAEPVIVSDIATDPLWAAYRDLALAHGLRACWSTPILSSDGRVLGTFAIYYREPRSPTPQDHNVIEQITHLASIAVEREQAEEALHKAQAELAHVTRVTTLGELTASIAHEVNQPLSAIVTNGGACLRWLAAESPNLDEAREAARRIIRDAQRAGHVITRIRAMLQKTDTQKARLDINDAIRDIVALAQGEVSRNRVTLRMELAADLPPVLGDRVQLQQVILNLLMNGVEAMAVVNDRPRELCIQSRSHESDKVLIAVQDCGIGLDRENLGKIFDAFYTTKSQGMGMGLAISRSIVENHGGRLWATANKGAGVTFQFTLPKYDRRTQHA